MGLGENWELGWKICTANVTCWGQTNKAKKEIIPVEIFPAIKAVMMIISPLIKIVVPVKMTMPIFPCTVARLLSAKRTCCPTPPPSLTQTLLSTPTESQSLP